MSKLIYVSSFNAYKAKYTDWESSTSAVYRSIAYTADGYIITHGRAMKTSVEGSTNPWGLDLTLNNQDLTVTVAGEAKTVSLPVVGAVSGVGTTASITAGKIKIDHANYGTAGTFGPTAASNSVINVPQVVTNAQGHVTGVTNFAATLDQVKRTASTGAGALLFAPASAGTSAVYYNAAINVSGGELSATSFKENGTALSAKYAAIGHTSVSATTSVLGHTKLSDSISTASYVDGMAATPKAVYDALTAAKAHADGILAANDAMVFKGTLGTGGTVTSLPIKGYSAGWTYRVITAGTYAGVACEIGDLIIAVVNSSGSETSITNSHWTVAQTNIDGAVTAAAVLTDGQIVLGAGNKGVKTLAAGTNGQVLKVNASGLPYWGTDTNTDTWRSVTVGGTAFLGTGTNTGALNFAAGAESGITVTGNAGTVTISSNFSGLGFFNGSDTTALLTYSPTSAASIAFSGGLTGSLSGTKLTVGHSNSITANTTGTLGKVKYNSNGHITGIDEVTSLKNPNAVTFGVGTSVTSYDGSAAVNFKIATGATSGTGSTDFSLAAVHSGGVVTITPTYNKKYRAFGYFATSATASAASVLADTVFDQLNFKPANGNVTLGWDATAKAITISTVDTNTWRKVTACKLGSVVASDMLTSSIGTDDLEFSSDFAWSGTSSSTAKLHMMWTEIAEDGTITYAV